VEAERLGANAICGACRTYARFSMISPSQVRCRMCGHEWRLIQPDPPG